jgi:integrase
MPRTPQFTPYRQGDNWIINVPGGMTASAQRFRKAYPTKGAAEAAAAKLRASYKIGVRGSVIPVALAHEAQAAVKLLEPLEISLIEAARIVAKSHALLHPLGFSLLEGAKFVARTAPSQDPTTFRDRWVKAVDESDGRLSRRYLRDLSKMHRWLPTWFMQTRCCRIDKELIEKALVEARPLARSTIETRARYISAILNYRPRHVRKSRPQILTPEQTAALLAACQTPEETRVIALLLYAGIRPEAEDGEISRLEWQAVGAREIYIAPEVAKTRTDRIIPIRPVLKRLLVGHPNSGRVIPPNWARSWKRIRKQAEIIGADVTRHTYASHHLVAYGEDATKNAMGHTAGSTTLFRHYRAAVSEKDAKAYFK